MIDLTQLHVDRELGAGSQGKVFLASDPAGTRYTVKLLTLGERADRPQVFDRAAQFRADLIDPSMVPILSYGMVSATPPELARQLGKLSKDALVLVLPFVSGTTLAEIAAREPLGLMEGVAALAGIANALAKLPAGVAHGDVRTPNVFVRPSGEVALADPDLSTAHPDPADDLRALAAIAGSIARSARADGDALAVGKLEKVFDEISRAGGQPRAADVAQQFGEVAALLGAPPGNLTSVLARLVHRPDVEGAGPGVAASTIRRRRGRWAVAATTGVLGIAAVGAWLVVRRPMVPRPPTSEPAASTPTAAEAAPAPADSLYDATGTVHYDELIHQLAPAEKIAANDGLVQFEFEDSIPQVALLSARKETLWEMRSPPAGGSVYLDAKPGHYYVEQDRDVGGTTQRDLKLEQIDLQHPLRVRTTRAIVNSPRRPTQ